MVRSATGPLTPDWSRDDWLVLAPINCKSLLIQNNSQPTVVSLSSVTVGCLQRATKNGGGGGRGADEEWGGRVLEADKGGRREVDRHAIQPGGWRGEGWRRGGVHGL